MNNAQCNNVHVKYLGLMLGPNARAEQFTQLRLTMPRRSYHVRDMEGSFSMSGSWYNMLVARANDHIVCQLLCTPSEVLCVTCRLLFTSYDASSYVLPAIPALKY